MTESDIKGNWYYFQSLANQLQQTEQFVDHCLNEKNEIQNGSTFSNEFAKILMLAASEFEVILRSICKESKLSIKKNDNIVKISKKVLSAYPNIVQTLISTPYMAYKPLNEWKVISISKKGKLDEKVEGIPWWNEYNGIKHNRINNFTSANLKNCVNAMASLMVLELYLSQVVLENIDSIRSIGCRYFDCPYGPSALLVNPGKRLPDFE